MEPRISIVTLGVQDLERSLSFYRDGLGLTPSEHNGSIVFIPLRGLTLALFPRDALAEDAQVPVGEAGFSGITLAHNVETEREVDGLLKQAESAGGRIVKYAQKASWGGYSGYFADPDGHLWEVADNSGMM